MPAIQNPPTGDESAKVEIVLSFCPKFDFHGHFYAELDTQSKILESIMKYLKE